jgi:hypothetical protein
MLPKIKKTFQAIWNTDDLIVSFDAGNVFRPWKYNAKWKTSGGILCLLCRFLRLL